jgi:hypothetical protein
MARRIPLSVSSSTTSVIRHSSASRIQIPSRAASNSADGSVASEFSNNCPALRRSVMSSQKPARARSRISPRASVPRNNRTNRESRLSHAGTNRRRIEQMTEARVRKISRKQKKGDRGMKQSERRNPDHDKGENEQSKKPKKEEPNSE